MTRPFGIERSGRNEIGESNAERALNAQGKRNDQRFAALNASLPYSAASSTDWSGTAPATIAEALDRLAAALGPIP